MRLFRCKIYAISIVIICTLTIFIFLNFHPSDSQVIKKIEFGRPSGLSFAHLHNITYENHLQNTWFQYDDSIEVVSGINRHIGGKLLAPSLQTHSQAGDMDSLAHVPVMLLKIPRSGSTWAAELLNDFDDVYLSKEIIQRTHKKQFDNEQAILHLQRALQTPTDKIGHSNAIFDLFFRFLAPSGRFMIDYIYSLKFTHQLNIIGFTVNPLHFPDANYRHLLHLEPKIVLLVRTNIAKLITSDIRGRQLRKKCNQSNLSKDSVCSIGDTVHVPLVEFIRLYHFHSNRMQLLTRIAYDFNIDVLEITYEDLQKDSVGLSAYVRKHLLSDDDDDNSLDSSQPQEQEQTAHWVKRTGEDLSQVITNYDEIRQVLVSEFGKDSCIYRQLESKTPFSHSPCYYPFSMMKELYLRLGGKIECLEGHWCDDVD